MSEDNIGNTPAPTAEHSPKNIEVKVQEAVEAVESGTHTPEDAALIEGFEAGAAAATELRSEDERTQSGDLLDATDKRIDHLTALSDTEKGWGTDTADIDTELRGHKDFKDYLEGRDYRDTGGKIHDAQTGRFVSAEKANDRPESHDQGSLIDLPIHDKDGEDGTKQEGLLSKWAEAENFGDKTLSNDIQDELMRRIENEQQLTDDQKTAYIDRLHEGMTALRKDSKESGVGPEVPIAEQAEDEAESKHIPVTEQDSSKELSVDSSAEEQPNPEELSQEVAPESANAEQAPNSPESAIDNPEANNESADDYHETEHSAEQDDERAERVVTELAPEIIDAVRAEQAYNDAIANYASAKIRAERMFAGKKSKEALAAASQALAESHNALLRAQTAQWEADDRMQQNAYEHNGQAISDATEKRDGLVAQRAQAGESYDGGLDAQIEALDHELEVLNTNQAALQESIASRPQQREAIIAQRTIELRDSVEKQMQEQREKAHPKWSKFTKWVTDHPKVRMAIGAGLLGVGILGTATGLVPLTALSIAGGAMMRGVGAYGLSRSVGDMISKRQLRGDNLRTVEDYLAASSKDSTSQRWSKRAGAIIAVAAAVGPAIGQIQNMLDQPRGVTLTPTPESTPEPQHLNIKPGSGDYPWNNGMNHLDVNISDPSEIQKWVHYPGIEFTSNGLGGGQGAITSVTYNGHTFYDFKHINGALNYIYNHPIK